jgi:hypothetical protein
MVETPIEFSIDSAFDWPTESMTGNSTFQQSFSPFLNAGDNIAQRLHAADAMNDIEMIDEPGHDFLNISPSVATYQHSELSLSTLHDQNHTYTSMTLPLPFCPEPESNRMEQRTSQWHPEITTGSDSFPLPLFGGSSTVVESNSLSTSASDGRRAPTSKEYLLPTVGRGLHKRKLPPDEDDSRRPAFKCIRCKMTGKKASTFPSGSTDPS